MGYRPQKAQNSMDNKSDGLDGTHRGTPAPTVRISYPRSINQFEWPDGYVIELFESDSPRGAFIRIGSGPEPEQPKAEYEIRQKLMENGLNWEPSLQAWGKRYKRGDAATVREVNRQALEDVENAYYYIGDYEEKARGEALPERRINPELDGPSL